MDEENFMPKQDLPPEDDEERPWDVEEADAGRSSWRRAFWSFEQYGL